MRTEKQDAAVSDLNLWVPLWAPVQSDLSGFVGEKGDHRWTRKTLLYQPSSTPSIPDLWLGMSGNLMTLREALSFLSAHLSGRKPPCRELSAMPLLWEGTGRGCPMGKARGAQEVLSRFLCFVQLVSYAVEVLPTSFGDRLPCPNGLKRGISPKSCSAMTRTSGECLEGCL